MTPKKPWRQKEIDSATPRLGLTRQKWGEFHATGIDAHGLANFIRKQRWGTLSSETA
jgi:hypothetical protein